MSLSESPEAENRSCPYPQNSKVPILLDLTLFLLRSLPFQSPHSFDHPCKKCITSLVLDALRAFELVLLIAAAEVFTATGLCTLAQLVPANQRRGSNSGWPIRIVVSSIRGDLPVQYLHKHIKYHYEPGYILYFFCILKVIRSSFIIGPCAHQNVYCTLKICTN